MKASEFTKVCIASVRLYGFVSSQQVIELFNHYHIEINEKEFFRYLKSKLYKNSRYFWVFDGENNQYLITQLYADDDSLDYLAKQKAGKPMYYPKTYEEFLNYSDWFYEDKNDKEAIENISRFLQANIDEDPIRIRMFTSILIDRLKDEAITEALDLLNEFGFTFETGKDIDKFVKLVGKYSNNLRIPTNNGFTPNEMMKMHGPMDLNNTVLTIGPNMRQHILDGETDPYALLVQMEQSNMPIMMKESFKKQLLEIIDTIENRKKS